nr:hypothetical protein [Tanacetum cinerariifolium]
MLKSCLSIVVPFRLIILIAFHYFTLSIKTLILTGPYVEAWHIGIKSQGYREPDSNTLERPPSQDPYEVIVAQWRSRVAARSSPPSPPVRQILPALPGIPRRPAILVFPGQPIPIDRPYRTQPNGVRKMLTARKRVEPLPTHRLALRYSANYYSSYHFTSDDSSRDAPSDSSSKTSSDSHSDTSSDSSSRHSSSGYAISDSPCDSPTATSARPYLNRCRSPTTSVPVASHVCKALSLVRANLLPPPDINAYIAFADDIAARGTDVRVEMETAAEEEAESKDFPELVSADGSLERDQRHRIMATNQQSPAMSERISTLEWDNMRLRGMLDVERQRVDRLRRSMSTMPTAIRTEITQDAINELIDKRVTEALEANGNPNVNNGGVVPVTRECTYQDFVKCQPLNFKGTEGVIGLTHWFEKIKMPFHIMKGNDMTTYNQRFQDLTMLCTKMVLEEEDQPFKRTNVNGQNVARAYMIENNVERGYAGALPYYNKCIMHHEGPCMTGNTCYECGRQGHYRNECPKLRNQNCGNKTWNKTGTMKDSGADRSFMSTTFSAFIDVISSTLDTSYAVELADERISKTNVILRGYMLGLLGHPFYIDLMLIELGSFDVIVDMDWLAKYHAKGYQAYLAQVTAKKTDDKSKEKRLEDVPIVRDFPEVFPEDFLGLLPTRQVEFQIDLVAGVAPVARSLYCLAPSEMQELSTQLQELSDKGFIRPSSSPVGSSDFVRQEERWIFLDVYRLL